MQIDRHLSPLNEYLHYCLFILLSMMTTKKLFSQGINI